jgi:hypothetical protein
LAGRERDTWAVWLDAGRFADYGRLLVEERFEELLARAG